MSGGFDSKPGRGSLAPDTLARRSADAVGKHTLTEPGGLLPVRRKADAVGKHTLTEPASIPPVAAAGLSGTGSPMPHRDTIQSLFGRHDISHIDAHSDDRAAAATAALGAEAYATGSRVAFASSSPSLHTAAHEAAHVVQQGGGVRFAGGVGRDDDAYEQHADAVADRVVNGESAEDLLDHHADASTSADTAVQMKSKSSRASGAEPPRASAELAPEELARLFYYCKRLTAHGRASSPRIAPTLKAVEVQHITVRRWLERKDVAAIYTPGHGFSAAYMKILQRKLAGHMGQLKLLQKFERAFLDEWNRKNPHEKYDTLEAFLGESPSAPRKQNKQEEEEEEEKPAKTGKRSTPEPEESSKSMPKARRMPDSLRVLIPERSAVVIKAKLNKLRELQNRARQLWRAAVALEQDDKDSPATRHAWDEAEATRKLLEAKLVEYEIPFLRYLDEEKKKTETLGKPQKTGAPALGR